MPTYEFRCRTCDTVFSEMRPMIAAADPATCPDGHADTVKLLSAFASVAGRERGSGSGSEAAWSAPPAGGCGAACACH